MQCNGTRDFWLGKERRKQKGTAAATQWAKISRVLRDEKEEKSVNNNTSIIIVKNLPFHVLLHKQQLLG
jgi:hypothetical protein